MALQLPLQLLLQMQPRFMVALPLDLVNCRGLVSLIPIVTFHLHTNNPLGYERASRRRLIRDSTKCASASPAETVSTRRSPATGDPVILGVFALTDPVAND